MLGLYRALTLLTYGKKTNNGSIDDKVSLSPVATFRRLPVDLLYDEGRAEREHMMHPYSAHAAPTFRFLHGVSGGLLVSFSKLFRLQY